MPLQKALREPIRGAVAPSGTGFHNSLGANPPISGSGYRGVSRRAGSPLVHPFPWSFLYPGGLFIVVSFPPLRRVLWPCGPLLEAADDLHRRIHPCERRGCRTEQEVR